MAAHANIMYIVTKNPNLVAGGMPTLPYYQYAKNTTILPRPVVKISPDFSSV